MCVCVCVCNVIMIKGLYWYNSKEQYMHTSTKKVKLSAGEVPLTTV